MREGVPADDRLVVLHRERGHARDELRGAGQHGRVDAGKERHGVAARPDRHDDLFQRGVSGALAEPVDGAFDLPRAGNDAGQRIGDGETEIVVAMGREHGLLGVGHAGEDQADEARELIRRGIADRVGNIDGGGARLDRGLHAAAEEIVLGAGRVHRRPFDVVGIAPRARDRCGDALEHLGLVDAHLIFAMERRSADEGMDAAARGGLDRLRAVGRCP